MALLKIFLLVAIVVVCAAEKDCGEERGQECLAILLNSFFSDVTEEQMCSDMVDTVRCLRSFVDECVEGERDPEIDEGLSQLDTLLKENCGATDDEPEDYSVCVHDNREYLFGCVGVMVGDQLAVYGLSDDEEPSDEEKCRLFKKLEQCLVDRTVEKCGEAAGKRASEDLKSLDLPWVPQCGESDLFSFVETELLNKKKRK